MSMYYQCMYMYMIALVVCMYTSIQAIYYYLKDMFIKNDV